MNWKKLAPLGILIVGAIIGAIWLGDALSLEALAERQEQLTNFVAENAILAVLLFVSAYAVIVAFSLPGALFATLAGGMLFGTFPGVIWNVLGATIGATAIYLAVRFGIGDDLAKRMDASEGRVASIKKALDESQWSVLFIIRLIPLVPFFVANLLPGLVGVPLHRYVITTFFGIMPGALVYTSIGAGLADLFAAGETPDLGVIFQPNVLGPLLGLAALAALPLILKPVLKRQGL